MIKLNYIDGKIEKNENPTLPILNSGHSALSTVYLIDCIEGMKQFPDKIFDLAVVDPPYGISIDNNKKGNFVMTKHKSKGWDNNKPTREYWHELFRVSKNQIVWGGNYFELPLKKGWLCWDKCNPLTGKFSDFELAWTSFLNCDRMYKQEWIGFGRKFIEKDTGIHPTQKPKRLYDWIFKEFSSEGNLILDTHLGSQSSRIEANRAGLDFVGFEIDREYFDNGNNRFKNFVAQGILF